LATKCGQLKEYAIDNKEVICEVPDVVSSHVEYSGQKYDLSSSEFPYELEFGSSQPTYSCGILSGRYRALVQPYEYGKTYTIVCDPYEHTDFNIHFPVNSDLYRSLKYKI